MSKEYIIPACSGIKIDVRQDQNITVIDIEGGQVADFFAEVAGNPNEFLSTGVTIDCNESLKLNVGNFIYTNLYHPMMKVLSDDVGEHDLIHPCCRPEDVYKRQVGMVDDAYRAVADITADGGTILFVGTKKQAQDAIALEAERCGMFYVNERWLGGMLTNFKTIQSRIGRLKEIETMQEDGTFDVLPKKEVIALKKELEKLQKNLGGIKEMKRVPDAIFVVDPKKERICVQEAHEMCIRDRG